VEEPAEEETRKQPGPVRTRDRTKIAVVSGAARRSWISERKRTSARRQDHRWQRRRKKQAVRSQRGREQSEEHLAQMAEEEARLAGEE